MPDDELSAAEYNEYLRTGRLPRRFDGVEVLTDDTGVRAVLPISRERARRKLVPLIPSHRQAELTEKQFQKQIVTEAKENGWTTYHNLYAVGSDPGYPDLTCVHPAFGVVWFEVKGPRSKSKIADKQRFWIATLRASGQRAWIVHPPDIVWISAVLQGYDPEDVQ